MFGYVKPFQPELRVKELDAYKAVYCGLCGQMGRSFGPLARLALSYDFTFVAMLGFSLGGAPPAVERRRCYVNPLKKVPVCLCGEPLELGADVASVMLYYKLLDNIADSSPLGSLGWQLLRPPAGHARGRAAAARPWCDRLIFESMDRQRRLEAARVDSADAAAAPTSDALAGIFRQLSGDTVQQRVLERLGALIGRFTYLCDALDDMESDAARGGYNPYILRFDLAAGDPRGWEKAREEAVGSLYMTIGEAEKAFALLSLGDFRPILENIVTMGLRASVDEILSKKEQGK